MCAPPERKAVGVGEGREAWTEGGVVGPAEGMQTGEAGEVDVVVEEDDVADAVGGVEAAGGVGGCVVLVVVVAWFWDWG